MNAVSHMSPQGEVTIPEAVRSAHGWQAGTRFEVIDRPDGVLLRATGNEARRRLTLAEFRALVPPHDGPALSIEDMDAAVVRLAGA